MNRVARPSDNSPTFPNSDDESALQRTRGRCGEGSTSSITAWSGPQWQAGQAAAVEGRKQPFSPAAAAAAATNGPSAWTAARSRSGGRHSGAVVVVGRLVWFWGRAALAPPPPPSASPSSSLSPSRSRRALDVESLTEFLENLGNSHCSDGISSFHPSIPERLRNWSLPPPVPK